ncbi:MAG: GIY-YIG nuclease family protein [Petrotogales bacterium]
MKAGGGTLKITQEIHYYVYIIRCKDGSYYTGYAKDVKKRFEMHKKGRGARYTKMHEPEKLVYVKEFGSRSEAMKRERKIKRLSHSKKRQLITEDDGKNS